ncbi:metallophosphoesterase [Paenibacillus filicis]|uniref:Metallophosphoesterase n=1 Tax=Paenibacillus gyeongsangnamensis TaxID=3388067 RepID=A0ABT4Q3S9_9BACL|nr:metallophosphoesterase [Paenibacillus filicis]MCZ8511530.1 metallophosphoesterase [Paenibacillus filicis]
MLKIALMGDLHYPAVTKEDNPLLIEARDQFFKYYFQTFLETEADYHISIGDITHLGIREEFEAIHHYVRNGSRNFRFVLGNHDILAYPKSELLQYTNQPRYSVIETDEALLVFLDTTKELELHGWGLDAEQWEWLPEQLRRSEDKALMIFAHHPVPGTTSSSPGTDAPFEPFQDIRPLLSSHKGTGLYFNGHTHTHSIVEKDSWHYIQTAAAICHPSIRIIELNNNQVQIKSIELDDEPFMRNRQYLHDHLKGFHRPKGTIYESKDLSHTLTINKRN